ncbi:plasmid mobilization relaxosome protein MobC [uncultured Paraglaciecola sp.]|uniref:plasmid mobilization protein n=1 Tax=uncultured Paraglaciecola sp. TaxID=1765024 RepID=UPI00262947E4|nr:plasmid mobilization relaxosome protein MobC [uncultured Paraglaciecola sp.]
MSKKTHKQYPRLSIRLSDTERLDIENRAERAGLSMGGYCKFVIFNTDPPRRSRRVVPEKAELSRLIGQVSRVGANINQIAKQLNMYSAIDVVEVSNAMADVAELRASIMKALGYREETEDDH